MSVQVPEFGGCVWPVDPACFSDQWEAMDESVKLRALALASATLTRLTGARVGNCPIKVRPVPGSACCFIPTYGMDFMYRVPHLSVGFTSSGAWVNNCGVGAGVPNCSIALPAPVGRIDEVKVDGVVVDPSDYTILEGRYLVWIGGGDCAWPTHQDVTLPDTQVGTMSVTYLNAYPVDANGAYAAGLLAMEFAKACADDATCRLPRTVTQVTRQGITFDIPTGAFPNGQTGIQEVDAFIALWNPKNLTQASTVWSPDLPRMSW